jgi:two-component system, OmpR family, KDP operon response regulator KdpE
MGVDSILIIEDEASIRKFLRISLEAYGFAVREARSAEAGLTACMDEHPALVILDLGLPDMDGREVITRVREWSMVPIVVLSVRSDEAQKVAALDSGANDYVTKPFGISELMARIRAALRDRGGDAEPPAILDSGPLRVDLAKRVVSLRNREIQLSRKEFALLALLVKHTDQVLTHQKILGEVWDSERPKKIHHLRVLVGQLRQKLGDDPARPRFIHTVQGVGYRLLAPDPRR